MSYKEIINGLEAYEYSKYRTITSCEQLMLFAAHILKEKNVPLTFNYICIATFKLFPDKFCCDEEFKEFPSVDRLNRTLMHLKYVKKGLPYLTGTPGDGYKFTSLGEKVAKEVDVIIRNTSIDANVKAPKVDAHKRGFSKDYLKFTTGEGYKKYCETGTYELMYIWEFYNVVPYTRIKFVKENLELIKTYALEQQDDKCVKYISTILKII